MCEKMFQFLHNIRDTRYKNLKKSLHSHCLATRSHGNIKQSPFHALSLSATELFIMNYAEPFFSQAKYLAVADQISACFPRLSPSEESGKYIRRQWKKG